MRRLLLAQEVGLEGLHAGGREQHRRVVGGGDQRRPRACAGGRAPRRRRGTLRGSLRSERGGIGGKFRRLLGGDRAVADDAVAVHQAGGLARRDAERRAPSSVMLEPRRRRAGDAARHAARSGSAASRGRRARRRGAAPCRSAGPCAWRGCARGPTTTRLVARVRGQHVQRLAGRDAEALALPDREAAVAAVAAEHAARACRPRRRGASRTSRVAGEEALAARAGEEAEVLALALLRDREAAARAMSRTCGLGEPAEREAQAARAASGRSAGEHVGLVLVRVGGARRAAGPRRRRRSARSGPVASALGAEAVGERQHRVEAHEAVAAHAGVRACGRRRARRGSRRRRRRGSASSTSSVRCGRPMRVGQARGRRAPPAGSSSCARRRPPGRPTA